MMKRINLLIAWIILQSTLHAQSPQGISYQTVVRDASNNLVVNAPIGLKLNLVQDDLNGPVIYSETHAAATNANGLISAELGAGAVLIGSFSAIDWSNGPWFITTETDLEGGSDYQFSGAQQLLSVPFAFYANTADSLAGGFDESDPFFLNSVAAGITPVDTAYWNQKQDALIAGPGIQISGDTISSSWHKVGDLFGGGIIISIWMENGEQHGLIASVEDLGQFPWSNVGNTVIGVTAQGRLDGIANSQAIMAQEGHISSAALVCENYSAGGFTDWYLPALWELDQLAKAYFLVQTVTGSISYTTLYWSSTEYEFDYDPWVITTDAYCMMMGYDDVLNTPKANYWSVRAFRKF